MRLGQTSGIHFASRIVSSVIGFVAMVYFARELGSGILGNYFLVLMLVSWLSLAATMGVGGAIQKRLSEDTEPEAHLGAGVVLIGGLFVLMSSLVLGFQGQINNYVGADVAPLLIPLLFVALLDSLLNAVLNGRHLVHVSAILTPVKTASRSLLQAAAVFLGIGLVGLLAGYTGGLLLSAVLALSVLSLRVARPRWSHIRSLYNYAKYSWVAQIQGSIYNWTDVAVLGFFVTPSLIGVYSIAWNIATFIAIFSSSISTSIFPEISRISANDETQKVAPLVTQSLTYAGLFGIPGLVGSILVGDRLLRVYGPEFVQGALVLKLLIAAIVAYSYQTQLLNTLNGVDRPDLALRVNTIFILSNVVLNVAFVYLQGMAGAAVATLLSATAGSALAYRYLVDIVAFDIPVWELTRQVLASGIMALALGLFLSLNQSFDVTNDNFVILLSAILMGVAVYFVVLFAISTRFRRTVRDNLPIDMVRPT